MTAFNQKPLVRKKVEITYYVDRDPPWSNAKKAVSPDLIKAAVDSALARGILRCSLMPAPAQPETDARGDLPDAERCAGGSRR